MTRFILTVALSWIFSLQGGYAEPSERVALVIGNSGYVNVPELTNPDSDATDIAAALVRLGFEVNLLLDANGDEMREAFSGFSSSAESADISIVYFAGHGIELDKSNYLIPVNAQLTSDLDIEFETIPLDLIMRSLSTANGVKIVLIDACRENPFKSQINSNGPTRSIGTGLVRVDPIGGNLPGGVLVGYAAGEGKLALDGQGRNSPYAAALLEHLEVPGLEISKLFRKVRDQVFENTDGFQEPFVFGSLPGEDIFLQSPDEASEQNLTAALSKQNKLTSDFAQADLVDTLAAWSKFLREHSAFESHPLYQRAAAKQASLADKAISSRNPGVRWLNPASGFTGTTAQLSREERRLVQEALLFMGFDPGPIDGQFGQRTSLALSRARIKFGLTPGDEVDYELLKVLPNVPKIRKLMSEKKSKYEELDISDLNEPRLTAALTRLGSYDVVFDYFRGSLYLAVFSGPGHEWHHINRIASEAGGHLATIESNAENRFIYELFAQDKRIQPKLEGDYFVGPTIGLYQPRGSIEPKGGWTWVTGEPLAYSNWAGANPDNHKGRQNYARFYSPSKNGRARFPYKWDDGSFWAPSFIMEVPSP